MTNRDRRAPLPFRAVRWLGRMIAKPQFRYNQLMQRGLVPSGFQPNSSTWEDRYPRIFDFVQSLVQPGAPVRILSFGCSTGEEVFTLRRRFPAATVRGLDINPANIRACRRRQRRYADRAVSFARASSTRREPPSSYDMIFCMAVLRDSRLTERRADDCRPLLNFDDFASAIGDFHRRLKPGGLLVIRHSNFRLCDTPYSDQFEVLLSLPVPPQAYSPIFGSDNRLMPGVTSPDTVFRKRPASTSQG
jgi:SAM-dependent methyltransferase